ncbi:MAG: FHA domain-containing protein [Chloroflexi bacterium]|nr:MAG: FHA domain-containing protein [Chloroflexota bacterium]
MSDVTSGKDKEYFRDHLVVRHPDGKVEKFPLPEEEGIILRIGRELDNNITLTDSRASRYHAEIRRTATGIQIRDLESANGTVVNGVRLKPDAWMPFEAGQVAHLGETRLHWEKAPASQSTVVMPAFKKETIVQPPPKPTGAPPSQKSLIPLAVGAGVIVLLLVLIGAGMMLGWFGGQATPSPVPTQGQAGTGRGDGSLSQQTPGAPAADTPTPAGPLVPLPNLSLVSAEVKPIMLGALPSTDKALLLVNVRVENVGNAPFVVSTRHFSLRTKEGQVLAEAGGATSPEGLKRLGARDRFDNLTLTPGGSVPESLIFEVQPQVYQVELIFDPPEAPPLVLGLPPIDAGRELAVALGTPVADETPAALAAIATTAPTPTPTRPAAVPAPKVVPRSALRGTIAYPVFNGNDFDLYLGRPDGGGTRFFRAHASQPAFNSDGTRIAFHSWAGDSRGLVTMDVTGANGKLVTNFIEDQLPTWTPDGQKIVFLTRRTGGRQSQLMLADANTELADSVILGEGEYPTVGANGKMVFKGWGKTAFGLRISSLTMEDVESVTNAEEDTAPALSPNGRQIVFMSRREGNWNIYIVNVDGSGLKRLTDDVAEDGLPVWSPDGNAIAFVSNRGGPWAVWAMTPDGAGKRQLFTMEGSPDGFVGTDTYASRGWAEERLSWTAAELVEQ